MKQRLDLLLVELGLAPSRQIAQALIMSGRVAVEGRTSDKPGSRVDPAARITVNRPDVSYVGRGGVKLAGALDTFGIDLKDAVALDVGSSTGGFTDCMLQRGARRVVAVDVGRGQLDWRLRNDSRVIVAEGMNARYLSAGDLPDLSSGADLITIDVSFISLRLILPAVSGFLRGGEHPGSILALVKPQFEVGRGLVGRGGIVRDPALRRQALIGIAGFARDINLGVIGLARSPITGSEGNMEYFIRLAAGAAGLTAAQIENEALGLTGEEPSHA